MRRKPIRINSWDRDPLPLQQELHISESALRGGLFMCAVLGMEAASYQVQKPVSNSKYLNAKPYFSFPLATLIRRPCVLIHMFLFFNYLQCLSLVKMHQRKDV